jgi:hypothetical protein
VTIARTVEWYRAYYAGAQQAHLAKISAEQITSYMAR